MNENNDVVPGKSKIHGTGLFARKNFKAGEKIGEFAGPPAKKHGKYVVYIPVDEKISWDGILTREDNLWLKAIKISNVFKFINHSSDPNCEAQEIEISAVRNIKAGEEITINYGSDWL